MQPVPSEDQAHVLIVDDDEITRMVIGELLGELGYTVLYAEDAESALSQFTTNRVDVVITDLGLPKASGWRLGDELKTLRSDIPVIVYSGQLFPDNRKKAEEMGVDFILTKPCPIPVLMDTLNQALGTD